jgi:HAD superfamily hydrolase (TIGR01509 family)
MKRHRFELVIFDCDGVLVDSELITNRIFAEVLREFGVNLSLDEIYERFVGRSTSYCLQVVAGLMGRPVPDEFFGEYHARSAAALRAELKAVPGIEAVLAEVAAPYCVASSGTHEKMHITLSTTGLLPKFQGRMFSVTEVANSKPFPDVFLHAAKQLGVAPSACAVVEDTPTGVLAGVAAGMTVFGYCAVTPRHRLVEAGAHHTFDHMGDLLGLMAASDEVKAASSSRT